MKRLCSTKGLSREDWLKIRRQGIGGSEIAAIVGLNPYSSALSVYIDKIGEGVDQEENEAMHWGNVLEPVVAEEFARVTGLKVRRENAILQHPDHPWALANVDRIIVGPEGKGILECKTAGFMSSSKWDDDKIPDSYHTQLLWYLAVTGLDYGYIACLIGGQKFVYQRVERDDDLIADLLSIGEDFWNNHVLPRQAPPIDGTEMTSDWLNKAFTGNPDLGGVEVPEAEIWVERYRTLGEQIKAAEEERLLAANTIKHMMAEHQYIFCGECQPTWKTVTTKRFDEKKFREENPALHERYVKEGSHRRFSINKRSKG